MKRRIVLVLTLALVLTALIVPARPAKACDWCMAITYEQALAACNAQSDFEFQSCRILNNYSPGSITDCRLRALVNKTQCMDAHGYPGH